MAELAGLGCDGVKVEQYRFGRGHSSYYELARTLRQRPGLPPQQIFTKEELEAVAEQAELRATERSAHDAEPCGMVRLTAKLAGNRANFLILRAAGDR